MSSTNHARRHIGPVGTPIAADKSLFYYGSIYHRLFDPPLAAARRVVVELVLPHSTVLDLACGTGELCFALRSIRDCGVTGLDLSLRMLRFAMKANRFDDVAFHHGDATDLRDIAAGSFDYATVLLLLHELALDHRLRVIREGLRVARRLIIIDARAPLPRNAEGLAIRLVEATFGHQHHRHFRQFLAVGGIMSAVHDSGVTATIEHRSVFLRGCREAVVLKSGAAN